MTLTFADGLRLIGAAALGIIFMLVSKRLLDRADMLGPKQRRFVLSRWQREHWSDAQFVWLWRVNMRFWWVSGLLLVLAAAGLLISTAFGVELSSTSR